MTAPGGIRSGFYASRLSEQAASSKAHGLWRSSSKTEFCPVAAVHGSGVHRSAPLLESGAGTARVRICTRLALPRLLASMLAEGMPVRAKDFSQSCDEGPRMFPSPNASPGQRVQLPTCVHAVQVGRSFMRIDRTSFI